MSSLVTFSELNSYSSQQIRHYFGGKALGLYEAHQLGITIPPTWMVTTELHEHFLQKNPSWDDIQEFTNAAQAYIEQHLGHILTSLDHGLYAVRSSCQVEDSAHHSFAGIFETYLNVSKEGLSMAIAKVWGSPLQEKAKVYHAVQSHMGILIQPMIDAKYAGICFTVHPSPKTIFDNTSLVIEYAATSGEKVVQGEVIPFRLSGRADALSSVSENEWIHSLLKAINDLKKRYHREADIEFAVDRNDRLWLLQQRPISTIHPSHILDLSAYKRMYKRSLLALDVEFLIEGCSCFLAPYLEIPISLEKWMVMTTTEQNVQELWVHDILNDTVIQSMVDKIEHDMYYLARLKERYNDHHQRLTSTDFTPFFDPSRSLKERLFRWFEWMTPFLAHYYVPMFVIESLHTLILRDIYITDPLNADHDLFELATYGIASLADLLDTELRKLKSYHSYEECEPHLKTLVACFGFLKCRQVFESPYTSQDLFEMIREVPDQSPFFDCELFEKKRKKYFHLEHLNQRLNLLREWMRIRNQEMEYVLFAFLAARPLIQEVAKKLAIDIEDVWRSSKQTLLSGLESPKEFKRLPISDLAILRNNGVTILSDQLEIRMPSTNDHSSFKGRTVYGKGILEATVQVAFTPEELTAPSQRPCVLVTGMTTPDFVPLIRKHFDALITDEGGILCHAAIVAREVRIPCIVGTGMGSSILNNKTTVRIDFDRAEITII